jgi:hypothetical protein
MIVDTAAFTASVLGVAGLATILAAVSYHAWLARQRGTSVRRALTTPPFTIYWTAGMFLSAAGWGLLRRGHRWESTLSLVVAASFLWDLLKLARTRSVLHSTSDR